MPTLETRVETLEREARTTDPRQPVILLNMNETEAQALERCGHPPGTDAFFIKLVPLQPRGGERAQA
jgi:hypothetical protein